jgi:N-acetylglucosamine-6-sulfatase
MRYDTSWVMPTLGSLAEQGVTFTHAYATTPLCCPSRASILTGLYARHHGVLANDPPTGGYEVFDDRSTLATWLHSAGVRTGLVGRYLNGYKSLDIPPGWDFWFALWQWGNEYFNYRVNDNGEDRFFGDEPEVHSTRVLGQQAIRFLDQEPARPFLLVFAPRPPHGQPVPDPIDKGVFRNLELTFLPSFDERDISDKPLWVQSYSPVSEDQRRRFNTLRRGQLETLLGLDREIASMLERLRADGRLDRTWIIFTSDNGQVLGEHRLRAGKDCAYEECARVPLVVVPPGGLAAGRADGHLMANIDLAPTIAAIMGVEPGLTVDGLSLLPLVHDPSAAWRDALLLESWSDEAGGAFVALRTPDRKYVRYTDQQEEELYDELADPYELNNLAAEPGHAAEKGRLAAQLDALLDKPPGR